MSDPAYIRLSLRLHECIRLLAEGCTLEQIAWRLGICTRTVKMHLGVARGLLSAKNNVHLIALCYRRGIIPIEPFPAAGPQNVSKGEVAGG